MLQPVELSVADDTDKPDTMEMCHKCRVVTLWTPLRRGSKREQCVGCKDVFPCRSKCDHLDCADEKASWVKVI